MNRDFALLNTYFKDFENGTLWAFYNIYNSTTDDNGVSTVSLKWLSSKMGKRKELAGIYRVLLIRLGLLKQVGRRNHFQFLPIENCILHNLIKHRCDPKYALQVLEQCFTQVLYGSKIKRVGKKVGSHIGSHVEQTVPDEFAYSVHEQMQGTGNGSQNPYPGTINPIPGTNDATGTDFGSQTPTSGTIAHNTEDNKGLGPVKGSLTSSYLCGLVPNPTLETDSDPSEVVMNPEIRKNARYVYETWNTVMKEHAKREGTPIPYALKHDFTPLSETSLAYAICKWVQDNGNEWQVLWDDVIDRTKRNQFLKFGFGALPRPNLSWMFKIQEGKGTGVQRVLDGFYDNREDEIVKTTAANGKEAGYDILQKHSGMESFGNFVADVSKVQK